MTEEHTHLTREDLASMSAAEISAAHSQGRLNSVLGIPITTALPDRLTRDDLKAMSVEQIIRSLDAGQLEHITSLGAARAEAARTDQTNEENEENGTPE